MIVEDQSEVISFLSTPGTLGAGAAPNRVDTHASVVFLTEENAYKLKRAVRFPYLDYSTVDRRHRFCEAEVAVNRRTAPDLYEGVLAVTRAPGGELELGGDGEAVDWLVVMHRFDEETRFDRLAQKGALDRFAMEDLADAITRFHAAAEHRPGAGGGVGMATIVENNAASFHECPSGILDGTAVEALNEAARAVVARSAPILDARRDEGRVRHCHGDLHLRNIFLYAGRATLFDAIEFSDFFADIDVLYDLAFLIMDLDHQNLRGLASILLNRYLDVTADSGGLAVMLLCLSMRAAIRAFVDAVATANQSDSRVADHLRGEARRYLDAARAYLEPHEPRLVAIGGLSGSGKSRISRELAPRIGSAPGARIVRTDSTRKRLAGVPLGSRLGPDGYTPEMTQRTYEAVYEEVAEVLATGQSVIADAVFADRGEREAMARIAAEVGVTFDGLWLDAPAGTMQERVMRRRRNVSDATAAVVRIQLGYDLGAIDWHRVDTSGPREISVGRALDCLGLEDSNAR